jgi:hypothetical protein
MVERPPFKDRSPRLRLFGWVAILAGAASALLGGFSLLLLAVGGLPGPSSIEPRDAVVSVALHAFLAAALTWLGIGSVQRRRWVRPLMLTLAWTWLATGVAALVLLPALVDAVLESQRPELAAVTACARAAILGGILLLGVATPGAFIWAYRDQDLQRTCEAHNPRPDWTAYCAPSVLGLSVALAASGVLAALGALRPALPLFGSLWTGWPGALALVAVAGICAWLARETYRMTRLGWWATTVFLVLGGVSTWVTLRRLGAAGLCRALGYPDGVPLPDASFAVAAEWLTLATTLATAVYMTRIRRHFAGLHAAPHAALNGSSAFPPKPDGRAQGP